MIVQNPNLKSCMISYGGSSLMGDSSAGITAYLKNDRDMSTSEVASLWK